MAAVVMVAVIMGVVVAAAVAAVVAVAIVVSSSSSSSRSRSSDSNSSGNSNSSHGTSSACCSTIVSVADNEVKAGFLRFKSECKLKRLWSAGKLSSVCKVASSSLSTTLLPHVCIVRLTLNFALSCCSRRPSLWKATTWYIVCLISSSIGGAVSSGADGDFFEETESFPEPG